MRACLLIALLFPVFLNAAPVEFTTAKYQMAIADDLSSEKNSQFTIQLNSEQAINSNKQFKLNWRSDLGTMEIIRAETLKQDGSTRPVPENAIIRQSGLIGQYSFQDRASMMLAFPDLAVGDSISLQTQHKSKPEIPGHIVMVHKFSEGVAWKDAEFVLRMPANRPVYLDVLGAELVEDKTENNQRHLRWTYQNSKTRVNNETRRIDVDHLVPHIYVSTINSWDDLARIYAPQYREKTVITPEISAKAQSLVADVATPRQKAQIIYDWVRSNIRYVAAYLGDGGQIPHDAAWVFANRYGDCKDHAILLEAMLRSVGIESSPVFISNGTTEHNLPKVVVWAFNHAITYVPELDLYLDSTSAFTPFGELPSGDQDRPVLRMYEKTVLGRTPAATVKQRMVKRKTEIDVAESGSAVVTTRVEQGPDRQGWMNELAQTFANTAEKKSWLEQRMKEYGWQGSSSARMLSRNRAYTVTLMANDWLGGGEIGLARFTNAHAGEFSLLTLANDFLVATRDRDFECWPNALSETMTIDLPGSFEILALPRNQKVEAPGLTFTAEYQRNGNKIERHLDFVWAPQEVHCPASAWPAYHAAFRKIRQTIDTGVAYRRPVEQGS